MAWYENKPLPNGPNATTSWLQGATSGGIGNTNGMPDFSKKWYKGWVEKFGGRGRYGGGKEVFDMAKDLAKGGGMYNKLMAEAATPFVTAGLNAGKDYMRATGSKESSSGGNAQAGLLATLAAGRGGMAGTEAVSARLRDLTGLSAEERARLGLEIGEETNYRDYESNEKQMEWLRRLQKFQAMKPQGGGAGGGVYGGKPDPYGFGQRPPGAFGDPNYGFGTPGSYVNPGSSNSTGGGNPSRPPGT